MATLVERAKAHFNISDKEWGKLTKEKKKTLIDKLLLLSVAGAYWSSPEGIAQRIEMLSQSFTYKIVNNALIIYGESGGVTRWRWTTNPGASQSGPCEYCESQNGRIYRKGQFLPSLPAHVNCVCNWELIFEPEEVPVYVA